MRSFCICSYKRTKILAKEQINVGVQTKTVGDCHRLPGEKAGIKFDLFAVEEPDYIMMLMSSQGGQLRIKIVKNQYKVESREIILSYAEDRPI